MFPNLSSPSDYSVNDQKSISIYAKMSLFKTPLMRPTPKYFQESPFKSVQKPDKNHPNAG